MKPSDPGPGTALLQVTGLTASYGAIQVLSGLSLNVWPRSITALLGPNGAGKTTVLRAICGMVQCAGQVLLNGSNLVGQPTEKIARAGIAHVPEGRGTFTDLSVEDNLRVGRFACGSSNTLRDELDRIYQWLPRLAERRTQLAGSMSGGEQQMLAIARALMARPKVLLLDEPSFGLAPRTGDEIFRILQDLRDREDLGVLLVEQNAARALQVADTAYVLNRGAIENSGPAALLASDQHLADAYLGGH